MSALSLPVLKKADDTGVGVSRAAVLYKVIQEGTKIEMVNGTKRAIQAKSKEILKAIKEAGDTTDDGAHAKLKQAFTGKPPLKYITKTGTVDIRLADIEKTEMFGSNKGSGGGAKGTALQESAAAWFSAVRFSVGNDLTEQPTDKQFAAVASLVSTDKSLEDIKEYLEERPEWIDSCCATANVLWNKFGKRNGYNWYRGGSFVEKINDHFKTVNKSYESPPFANLNKWTPADIWCCECSVTQDQLTNATNFASYNALLKEFIDDKILFGISLKKTTSSSITLKEVNYTASRPEDTFKDIYAKSFESLDVWMYTQGKMNIEVQFRDTSGGKGLQWQGEAIGALAKHGKIGGGVYSRILGEVTGKELFRNIDVYKSAARSGSLNNRLLKLAKKHEDIINGSKNPKKSSKFVAPKMTRETIDYHYNRTTTKGQWVFSKYMGLLFVDRMMDLSTTDQDKVANLIALYATSQSKDSAPYLKAM